MNADTIFGGCAWAGALVAAILLVRNERDLVLVTLGAILVAGFLMMAAPPEKQ